jgi:hypothetical protein
VYTQFLHLAAKRRPLPSPDVPNSKEAVTATFLQLQPHSYSYSHILTVTATFLQLQPHSYSYSHKVDEAGPDTDEAGLISWARWDKQGGISKVGWRAQDAGSIFTGGRVFACLRGVLFPFLVDFCPFWWISTIFGP